MKPLLVLTALICLASPAFSHPPTAISAEYNSKNSILTLTVAHSVENTQNHYIKQVIVKKDLNEVFKQVFDSQFNKKVQIVKIMVPGLKNHAKLYAEATCSIYGTKGVELNIIVPGTPIAELKKEAK
jgi:desulfoferrodoxin (superoxide reductase-like protein)